MLSTIRHSIQVRLSIAFTCVSLLAAVVAGGVAFYDSYHESNELQDDLLRQTAAYINPALPAPKSDSDNDAHIYVQTPSTPKGKHYLSLPNNIPDGFHTVRDDDGDSYRVYIENTQYGALAVMQENEYRQDLAARAAWNSALPLLLLIPLMSILTWWIVCRTMLPIKRLSQQVAARQDSDLSPLNTQGIPSEIKGFVQAINHLLQRTDEMLRHQQRFIADAAHELRSPMTALSVQAERLNHLTLPDEAQTQLASLQQGIMRNRHLLEQLLSLARAQAQDAPRTHQRISAQAIFRRVIEDLLPLAAAKGQDIGVASAEDAVFAADETEIYTLIKTLTDNAIRYTPEDGQIDLSVHNHADGSIEFQIEDNGMGIPAAERARVLDPFYRILGSEQQGTGLGLSIADTLVKRYGGSLVLADSVHFPQGLLVKAILLPKPQQMA